MPVLFSHTSRVILRIGLMGFVFLGLTGCQPPGPRALLNGERLIREGQFAQAVESLRSATEHLPNHAQSWNHLGLALHGLGKADEAVAAYQHALRLDRNLAVVHYNYGLILLENNRLPEAVFELTAFTTLTPNASDGWSKLGTALLRQKKWDEAERAFSNSHRLQPKDPETHNNLGLVLLQKRKPQTAAQWFNQALVVQPDYAPALLNAAIVSHHYFNAKPQALEHYRRYAKSIPTPVNVEAVRDVIQRLEVELQPKPTPVIPPVVAIVTNPPPIILKTNPPPVIHSTSAPVAIKPSEITAKIPTNTAIPAIKVEVKPAPVTNPPPQIVVVPPAPSEPVVPLVPTPIREDAVTNPPVASAPIKLPPPPEPTAPLIRSAQREPEKDAPSIWQKANPIRWFNQRTKGSESVANRKDSPAPTQTPVIPSPVPVSPPPKVILRYPFTLGKPPDSGNRSAADVFFRKGLAAHQAQRLNEAIASYQQAMSHDPAFFEAAYNLGLAGYQTRTWPVALISGETAVRINPTSTDARYNFALTLEAAGYFIDAVEQLEQGIKTAPQEPRFHFEAAAIYSEHLAESAKAREHYRKVLAIQPNHPQAEAVRRWLVSNP